MSRTSLRMIDHGIQYDSISLDVFAKLSDQRINPPA